MTYSQKYALAHFITRTKDGEQFHMADWPLHITLIDVFAIDRRATDIDGKLAVLLSKSEAARSSVVRDDVLGQTPVVLLEKTPRLHQLHCNIVTLLEENGAVFNNPEFTKEGFLPHSTIQKNGRLHTNDEVVIDTISLVDMYPDGDWRQRKILATFDMKN